MKREHMLLRLPRTATDKLTTEHRFWQASNRIWFKVKEVFGLKIKEGSNGLALRSNNTEL